jgi:diguanylate cyclase (GGDEF)-like protein/PAS domain S-box-containing protein
MFRTEYLARALGDFKESRIVIQVGAWMLLISILPLALASYLAHRFAASSLRREGLTHLAAIAESRANFIEAYLRERRGDIAVLAQNPQVVSAVQEIDRASLFGGFDSAGHAAADQQIRPYLSIFLDIYHYNNLLLISRNRAVVFSVDKGQELGPIRTAGTRRNAALAEAFERARTLMDTDISDYEPAAQAGKSAAFMAAPLFQRGAFVGVVALELGNDQIDALGRDYAGLGETGEIVIAARRHDRILFLTQTRNDPHGAFARTLLFKDGDHVPIAQAVAGMEGTGVHRDYRGKLVLAAWRYLPSFRWGLVVKIDADEALAPSIALRNQSILFVTAIALLLVLASSSIARSIGNPIAHLAAGVRRVRQQGLSERVLETGPYEIALLGREFNVMAGELEASYRSMEWKVAATRERLAEIIDATPDFVGTCRPDGSIIHINRAGRILLGMTEEESLSGIYVSEVLPAWAYALFRNEVVPALRKLGVWSGEYALLGRDGREIPVSMTSMAHKTADGSVEYISAIMRDITARKQAEQQLAYQVLHDPLTGLANRTLLNQQVERTMNSAREQDADSALLLLDLDRFKEINDTFGHHYGDVILQELRPRLLNAVRESDTVARLGGDEFGIWLPGADRPSATVVAERILTSLRPPILVEGRPIEVSISIGMAFYPEHGRDIETLMERADVAMYAAKRGQVGQAVYVADLTKNPPRRLMLVSELRQSIEEDQLLLHYQPEVNLTTMRVEGAEALIRWQHPRDGLIPPGEFIPLAERTGLINSMDRWTLQKALFQCGVWHQAGLFLNVSVNLAPESVQDGQLVDSIDALLASAGALPEWLTLEITERGVMTELAKAKTILTHLHEMGVRISIDDFGLGYSSLAYLQDLPVDEIKLDRSFVKNLAVNRRDACIVRGVIDLGHDLGLRVVAEGVEERAGLDLLASWGCDCAQGYYFTPALPPAEFSDWMARSTKNGFVSRHEVLSLELCR